MLAIDPEEVFGLALWESLQRAFGFTGFLLLGSTFAVLSALAAQFLLGFTPLAGSHFLPSFSGAGIFALPFWVMTSVFVFIAVPNALIAAFYYFRCEEPSARRFFIHAAIQQFCLTGAFSEWGFETNFLLESILSSALLWFFSLSFLGLLLFRQLFLEKQTTLQPRRTPHGRRCRKRAVETEAREC